MRMVETAIHKSIAIIEQRSNPQPESRGVLLF